MAYDNYNVTVISFFLLALLILYILQCIRPISKIKIVLAPLVGKHSCTCYNINTNYL